MDRNQKTKKLELKKFLVSKLDNTSKSKIYGKGGSGLGGNSEMTRGAMM